MHIAIKNKNSSINSSYTQQKKHSLMPFEKNCILKKLSMTNTPIEIDKYGSQKNDALQKCYILPKKL